MGRKSTITEEQRAEGAQLLERGSTIVEAANTLGVPARPLARALAKAGTKLATKEPMVSLTMRFPAKWIEQLRSDAEKHGCSISDICREAIVTHIKGEV